MREIVIHNLPANITVADVHTMLSPFGGAQEVHVVKVPYTTGKVTTAFAKMDQYDAASAVRELNRRTIGGQNLTAAELGGGTQTDDE